MSTELVVAQPMPEFIVLDTRHQLQLFLEEMSTLTDNNYDLNEIANVIVNLLGNMDSHPDTDIPVLCDHFCRGRNARDQDIMARVLAQLYQEIHLQLDRIALTPQTGLLAYSFHGWQNEDLVLGQQRTIVHLMKPSSPHES